MSVIDECDKLTPCRLYEHHIRKDGDVEIRMILSNVDNAREFPPNLQHTDSEAGWAYIGFVCAHAVQFLGELGYLPDEVRPAIVFLQAAGNAAVEMIGHTQEERARKDGDAQ